MRRRSIVSDLDGPRAGAGRRAMANRNMATDPDDGNWPPLSDEDRRGIARIRRQIDEEFGVAPEAPRWLDRWRRPLLLVLVGVAVGCAGGVVWYNLLSASRATESPRPAVVATPSIGAVSEPPAAPRSESTRALAVGSALNAWIDATQRGDIATQMTFYPAVVPVFYTWRDAPRATVLAEKEKVLGAARVLDIRMGAPTITVAADGDTAITRFRKDYVIEGPHVRRGAVIQELRWVQTDEGWKITSEREAIVLAHGSRRGASAASHQRMARESAQATTGTTGTATSGLSAARSMIRGFQTP